LLFDIYTVLTDTHTHLFLEQFDEDADAMMQRTFQAGVERLFLPNIDQSTTKAMNELAAKYPDKCFPLMGLHPGSIKEDYKKELDHVRAELDGPNTYYAVGEIGLDFYWDKTFTDQQIDAFRTQVQWAKELSLPIVIHCRESFETTIEQVEDLNDDSLRGVFHCFTGSVEDAERVNRLGGFFVGIGGVVTFKNSGLDAIVQDIPIEQIVLETDSPYLTPAPHRGERNESGYLTLVADKIAELHGTSREAVAKATTENSKTLFGI
jgi:TatD DNase family protein